MLKHTALVLGLLTAAPLAAYAAQPLAEKQMDQVTAGWSFPDLSNIGNNYTFSNKSVNQVSTPGTTLNNNNGFSGNQIVLH